VAELGSRATLKIVAGGDHSFRVPKSASKSEADVVAELADTIEAWTRELV
jgi:hypothetical protein